MNKLLIITVSLFLAGIGIKMHATEPQFPRYILSTKPLLLFDGEYKLSIERALNNPQHWVGIGLSAFYLPERDNKTWDTRNTINHDNLRSLKGFGADLTYKYYVVRNIIYVGADLFYGHYKTGRKSYSFTKYKEDGLVFYNYNYGIVNDKFNKLAGNLYFGVGTPIANRIFVETYIGVGRSGNLSSNDNSLFDSIFGFGYNGFYPVMGARIGVTFGR